MDKCAEFIMSEDTRDYIVEYNIAGCQTDNPLKADYCFKNINDTWCVVYGGEPRTDLGVVDLGYFTIPKLYGAMAADTTSFDSSGITMILNQPFLDVRGQGVIIGFVDTGIDYTLDIFKFSKNSTKIAAIWDQTIQSDTSNDFKQEFPYGTIYTQDDINEALKTLNEGGNPYDVVPSVDENGHGTFIAGVAAGARTEDYIGAAPDSQIVMVKLKGAKQYLRDFYLIKEGADAYQETDLMMGVKFLRAYADMKKMPLVVCIGMATASGARNGATPFADVLNTMAKQGNTAVVTCMGNEANNRTHASGTILSQEQQADIEINVGKNEKGFTMEIWADGPDILSVSLTSPSGEVIPRIPVRTEATSYFNFVLEQTKLSVDYRTVETISGYEVIFLRFVTPAEGIWRITLYSLMSITGRYNAWLPLKQFMTSDTYFLQSVPYTTLVEPSAAIKVISVGAYNHVTEAAYNDSGRGYTTDNRVKPDIVAPGVNVYGPVVGGGYTYKSGTSIAAAHVAGAAALLFTWGVYYENEPNIGNNEIKSILIRGAKRDINIQYPDNIFGYGKLDLANSFNQMRNT